MSCCESGARRAERVRGSAPNTPVSSLADELEPLGVYKYVAGEDLEDIEAEHCGHADCAKLLRAALDTKR